MWEEEKLLVSHSIFQLEERGALFAAVEIFFFFFNATVLAARRWRAQPLSIAFLVAHATYWQALHAEEAYCEHLEILHLDLCSFQFLP